ncbi:MAG: molybdopterin molybdotransferase MoeA [Thermodesulfobacteriota bacterium]|nr:molybdopterin molybdotransferase MoeA [Thermodesulfobacteriota bacterium]
MIPVEEAVELVMKEIRVIGLEKVDILSSFGRVVAEDIYSGWDVPSFDNSAMDGYALKSSDIKEASRERPTVLKIIEEIPAGQMYKRIVCNKEATRIMTGAPIPPGADTVVPIEHTERDKDEVRIFKESKKDDNIRASGEDVRTGDLVISKGTVLRPAEVGMMASVGRAFVHVYQMPRVAIISTGDELVDVDNELTKGKIINTNRYTLMSQVRECGGVPMSLGIAGDTEEEIEKKFGEAAHADVIVSSGGVSVGDYDLVRVVLKKMGAEMKFSRVAMRPGQPLTFGLMEGRPVFALPGNPVSSMISFEQFVRPSLLKMSGFRKIFRPVVYALLQEDISQKPGRKCFLRCTVSLKDHNYCVRPTGEQGAGILMSMVKSNGLLVLPEDKTDLKAGDKVRVQLLDKSFESEENPNYG